MSLAQTERASSRGGLGLRPALLTALALSALGLGSACAVPPASPARAAETPRCEATQDDYSYFRSPESKARARLASRSLQAPSLLAGETPERMTMVARMAHYRVPAMSLVAFRSGGIDWSMSRGFRRVDQSEPVTRQARFQVASLSKMVTAAMILRLAEEGKVDLDAPVERYLRRWKLPKSSLSLGGAITLRRLLSHTAGFGAPRAPYALLAAELLSLPEILDRPLPTRGKLKTRYGEPLYAVGERWSYSAAGYCVIQQVVEELLGMPFALAAQTLVFDPLQMFRTTFEQISARRLALDDCAGHRRGGSPLPEEARLYPCVAAAGLWSSAEDLARFGIELSKAYRGASRWLSAASVEALRSPTSPKPPLSAEEYGLGTALHRIGESVWMGHHGQVPGFRALLRMRLEEDVGYVILTNSDEGEALIAEVERGLARAQGFRGFEPLMQARVETSMETLAPYVGSYTLERGIPALLQVEASSLSLSVAGGAPSRLHFEGNDRFSFLYGGLPRYLEYQRAPQGRADVGQPHAFTLYVGARRIQALKGSTPPEIASRNRKLRHALLRRMVACKSCARAR